MNASASRIAVSALAFLALALPLASQEAVKESTSPKAGSKKRPFSGRVVDGLGRPVAGVTIKVESPHGKNQTVMKTVARTDKDGRYAGKLEPGDDDFLWFEKQGYLDYSSTASTDAKEDMPKKVNWDEAAKLPLLEGEELDRSLREFLASVGLDYEAEEGEMDSFVFKYQDHFRHPLRRLIRDPHVGDTARLWLDLLAEAGDPDLFPSGRKYAPKKEVKDADLVEALKATARQRNFFTIDPEPSIDIDFIAFANDLDRALIQCGINRAGLTGITWQFVFWKVGKQWELKSALEAGRS